MDLNTFQNSTWVKSAQQTGSREKVIKEFPNWLEKVANTDLRRMGGSCGSILLPGVHLLLITF